MMPENLWQVWDDFRIKSSNIFSITGSGIAGMFELSSQVAPIIITLSSDL